MGPAWGAWWLHRAVRRGSDPKGRAIAIALIATCAALSLGIDLALAEPLLRVLLGVVGPLVALHLLVWSGVGHPPLGGTVGLAVAQRRAEHGLPGAPGDPRAVVFAFFSTEPWQIADSLGFRR